MCAQQRLRSAWASAQSDQSLRCPHEESLGQLPFKRTAKTLIRLDGCPFWSESSLGWHVILLVLSWGGSYGRQQLRYFDHRGPPSGVPVPLLPEINRVVSLLPKIKILVSYVPISPKLPFVLLMFRPLFPLFLWNKCPRTLYPKAAARASSSILVARCEAKRTFRFGISHLTRG